MSHMDHDMGSMSMSMSMTGTTGAPASATSASSSMSGHDMGGMGGPNACKINMLWNWNTIDACFISRSWHVTSSGMFAGSCIGVLLLVITLEFLRRSGKEYDRYIIAQHKSSIANSNTTATETAGSSASSTDAATKNLTATATGAPAAACAPAVAQHFRPTILQQSVRALLHMLQFAVAYFVMLLAMYYNGYIIICIFIGAYIGYFIFGWESFQISQGGKDRLQENVTVCCG